MARYAPGFRRSRNCRPPDDGHILFSRGYAVNIAHAVLLAADDPAASGGKIYNAADTHQFTLGQWVEVTPTQWGRNSRLSVFRDYAYPARELVIGRMSCTTTCSTPTPSVRISAIPILCRQSRLAETVRWYRENPPSMPEEFEEDIKAHYKTKSGSPNSICIAPNWRSSMSRGPIDTPMRIRKPNEKRIIGADERGWLRLFAVLSGVCAVESSSSY